MQLFDTLTCSSVAHFDCVMSVRYFSLYADELDLIKLMKCFYVFIVFPNIFHTLSYSLIRIRECVSPIKAITQETDIL